MERRDALATLHTEMRRCRLCLDAGYSVVPGAVMSGVVSAEIMTIGQAPGVTEVEAKRPFNASSGRRLFQWLEAAGWQEDDFRANQYMTSVTKCFPGKHPNGKGDRVPARAEQALCRPYLQQEIALVRPRLIIPIGGLAIKLFYPSKVKLRDIIGSALYLEPTDDDFDISSAITVDQPVEIASGRYIVPLPHPSGASLWLNRRENQALVSQAIDLLARIRMQGEKKNF